MVINLRSRWKLDTTDKTDDSIGTYHFTEYSTISYNDSGKFDSGYADYSGSSTAYHHRTGSFGGSPNGAFSYCGFFYFNSFETSDVPLSIFGDTNSHRIAVSVQSGGIVSLGRRAKTGVTTGVNLETISTGSWVFLALGHDPDNNQVFAWVGNNKYTLGDNGDYDFTESGSETYLGGKFLAEPSIDGRASHASMYLDYVLTVDDVNGILATGEISMKELDSVTTVKRLAYADKQFVSLSAIKQLAIDDKQFVSDTVIQLTSDYTRSSVTAIFRAEYGEVQLDSWTAIYGITDMTVFSDTNILREEFVDLQFDSWVDIRVLDNEITYLSNTRVKRLVGGIIGKISQTYIIEVFDRTKTSITAISRAAYADVQLTSGTAITIFPFVNKLSDTNITILDNEITKVSDTFIIYRTDLTQLSDTLVLNVTDIQLDSNTRLLKSTDINTLSSSRVLTITDSTFLSNARIKSSLFIQIWYRSDSTISVITDHSLSSVTAIKRDSFDDVQLTSDTEIVVATDIQLDSQTAIQHRQETSEVSMTTIVVRTDSTKLSDTLMLGRYETALISSTTIWSLQLGTKVVLLSNTRIERPDRPSVDYDSDTSIVAVSKVTTTSITTIKGRKGGYDAVFRKAPGRF